jgi:hypothetical protein
MAVKILHHHDAQHYEFTNRTGQSINETDYVRLLLQSPFDINRLNLFLFVDNYPIIYSETNVKKFITYLSHEEYEDWLVILNNAFATGNNFKQTLGNFYLSGMSIGKAYGIIVESKLNKENNPNFISDDLKSLSTRAKKFKEYCDLIQDPFWIRNKNLELLFVNQAFLDIVNCHDIDSISEKKSGFMIQKNQMS